LQGLFIKKKNDFSFDFGKNLTVVIGEGTEINEKILELFLKSFHLNDSVIVNNLRNVNIFILPIYEYFIKIFLKIIKKNKKNQKIS
jgi:hypothetical protein